MRFIRFLELGFGKLG